MSAFASALATLFSDPNLSEAATFCPRAGAEVTLRAVMLARGHTDSALFQVGSSAPADVAEVRAADVAEPKKGDFLVIGAVRYEVRKAEYDGERLCWRLDLDRKA